MTDVVRNAQRFAANEGVTEVDIRESKRSLESLWREIKEIDRERVRAINDAVKKIEAEYDEKLKEMKRDYALLLKLSSQKKETDDEC